MFTYFLAENEVDCGAEFGSHQMSSDYSLTADNPSVLAITLCKWIIYQKLQRFCSNFSLCFVCLLGRKYQNLCQYN